jgi:isoleucyl-tRNA synthetase
MRRSADFNISDRILTYYQGDTQLDNVILEYGDYIRQETLSDDVRREKFPEGAHIEDHNINGIDARLGVVRL